MTMPGLAGVTAIETRAEFVTVKVVEPVIPLSVAWTPVVPTAIVVATPFEPGALLIVATAALSVDHATVVVRSTTLLSEYVPFAMNGSVVAFGKVGLGGVIA